MILKWCWINWLKLLLEVLVSIDFKELLKSNIGTDIHTFDMIGIEELVDWLIVD